MSNPPAMGPRVLTLLLLLAPWAPGRAQDEEEVVLGTRSGIRALAPADDVVLVEEGTRLYELPDRRSSLLAIVDATAPRPVHERLDGWVLLRIDGQGGWAAEEGGRTAPDVVAPPATEYLATRRQPVLPEAERLERALEIVGRPPAREIGPFQLYSNLEEPATIELLAAIASGVPTAYTERYGLEPWATDRFAVVVFASEDDYRRFETVDGGELTELEASGHAAGNVAALFAEGRRRRELASIFVHELTHLVNRSAFRGPIPAWLEEGLAEELSFSHVDDRGRIDPARLGGVNRRERVQTAGRRFEIHVEKRGAPATLDRLAKGLAEDGLLALPDLMAMSRPEMIQVEGRQIRYGQSAFFVRYLLEGAGERGRQALRGYLEYLVAGGDPEPERLRERLGEEWGALSRRFETWLLRQSRALEAAAGGG